MNYSHRASPNKKLKIAAAEFIDDINQANFDKIFDFVDENVRYADGCHYSQRDSANDLKKFIGELIKGLSPLSDISDFIRIFGDKLLTKIQKTDEFKHMFIFGEKFMFYHADGYGGYKVKLGKINDLVKEFCIPWN